MKARRRKEGKAEQRRRTAWRTAWQGAVARLSSNNREKRARKRQEEHREVAEAVATTIDTREGDLAWQGAGRERAIHNNNKRASEYEISRERKRAGKREQKRGNICKVAAELRVPYSEFFVDLFALSLASVARCRVSLACLVVVPSRTSPPPPPCCRPSVASPRLAPWLRAPAAPSARALWCVTRCANERERESGSARVACRSASAARHSLTRCAASRATTAPACASAASLANSCSRCLHVLRRP